MAASSKRQDVNIANHRIHQMERQHPCRPINLRGARTCAACSPKGEEEKAIGNGASSGWLEPWIYGPISLASAMTRDKCFERQYPLRCQTISLRPPSAAQGFKTYFYEAAQSDSDILQWASEIMAPQEQVLGLMVLEEYSHPTNNQEITPPPQGLGDLHVQRGVQWRD
ncbi:hypothetical protein B0H19DRAFT_1079676 [Mycena capillaripes]|nr:hypothetical protein B0H19DRAFT_1079676 [Mycena capillaripes]